MKRFLLGITISLLSLLPTYSAQPNFIFIFIDDCGWKDFSCYGSSVVDAANLPITPNIDRLAAGGTRFTSGYVAAPICSPSRVGVLTGTEPGRHGIHSFLDHKTANRGRNMNDWLQSDTVTSARVFRDAGYATGQFGKWHMGGGRDVDDAPFPQDYGFQSSLTSFEGMGDRVLFTGHGLSQQNADVPGAITWTTWDQGPVLHTDAAIQFITNAKTNNKPFFIHIPYDDTHSPYHVAPGHENDFAHVTSDATAKLFLGELHALDKQIGRVLDTVDGLGLAENTLIVLVGDNGAPNDDLNTLLQRNGPFRSGKGNLWEGGIRVPFIARMPGTVASGVVNDTTAVSTLDLFPTYCALAKIQAPPAPYAGENMLDVFQGSTRARNLPLFWEYGTVSNLAPSSAKLAVRRGNLKFLRNPDGSRRSLYNVVTDPGETNDLIGDPSFAETITAFESELVRWHQEVILGNVGEIYTRPAAPPALLISDSFDLDAGNSEGSGFGATTGINEGLTARQTGILAGSLRYLQTTTDRAANSHSIIDNALVVQAAANSTSFQLTSDGLLARDFGPELKGRQYEVKVTLDLDDPVISRPRMTFGIADSPAPTGGVGGHDLAVQLDLVTGNSISVFKRIDVGSHSGTSDVNESIRTGLPAGEPVQFRILINDSSDYTGLNTTYQIFVNGILADSGAITFGSDSRYFIFDVAGATGPARYDNFSVERLDQGQATEHRVPIVRLSQFHAAALPDSPQARLYWTSRSGDKNALLISDDLTTWEPLPNQGSYSHVITSLQGTLTWVDVEIPEAYRRKGFFRLQPVP